MNDFPAAQTSLWFSLPENSNLEELPRGVKRDLLTGFEELVTAAGVEPFHWSGPTGVGVSVSPAEVLLTEYEMDHQKVGILLKIRTARVHELVKEEARRLAEQEGRKWGARLALFLSRLQGREPEALLERRANAYQDGLAVVLQTGLILEMSRRINFLVTSAGSGMSPTLTKALEDLGRAMEAQDQDVAHGPERPEEDGATQA